MCRPLRRATWSYWMPGTQAGQRRSSASIAPGKRIRRQYNKPISCSAPCPSSQVSGVCGCHESSGVAFGGVVTGIGLVTLCLYAWVAGRFRSKV